MGVSKIYPHNLSYTLVFGDSKIHGLIQQGIWKAPRPSKYLTSKASASEKPWKKTTWLKLPQKEKSRIPGHFVGAHGAQPPRQNLYPDRWPWAKKMHQKNHETVLMFF